MSAPRAGWRLGWQDPTPLQKQASTASASLLAILIVVAIPGFGVPHPEAFLVGALLMVASTTFALVASTRRSWWRFESIVWSADFVAIGLLCLGTESSLSPLLLLPVLPVLMFAGMEGRRYVACASAGAFASHVIPVVIVGIRHNSVMLWFGVFGTLMLTLMAWMFQELTTSQRNGLTRQRVLARQSELLLQESIARNEELETSRLERSAAERMLRGVWLAVTEQAIVATDLDGTIVAWNPGSEKLLGYRAEQVVDLRQIAELLAPGQWEAPEGENPDGSGLTAFVALVGSGVERSTAEWTVLRSDGTPVPVQMSVTPRFDESGVQIGHLFVANDISEAREVAKLKDEFVGLISHELRTPLSSIIGYLELLRDEDEDPLTESQLHYLGVAERNAHRLLHLVGDLLFAAQVESGSFRIDQTEVDLVAIVTAAVETARPAANTAGVTLVSDFANDVTVTGDPVRLGQAVDNLVSNAVKFTPRGGTITLGLAIDGDNAVLSVRDTGMGIAAAEMDKLFSRFFRATTATANAIPGVGLGLTITKAIVTAHHGTMSVESEEGVGTCFGLSLPLVSVASESMRVDS